MKFKYLFIGLLALSSCSQEEMLEANDPSAQQDSRYPLTIEPFNMVVGGQTSRTTPNITPDKVSYTWNTGDEIGIFPFESETPKGDQVYFSVTANAENASHATFDGGGWQIKKDMNYIAYYPFIDKFRMNPKAMDVTFVGQAVKGLRDYSNFGKYDFMVAAPQQQASVDGGMSFQFKHVSALCVLRFYTLDVLGGYEEPGTLKSIVLELPAGENLFWETATMDLTNGINALTHKTLTNKISIDLTGYDYTCADREELIIPFMQGAALLKDKTCSVKLTYQNSKGEQVKTSSLTFNDNLQPGNGYFLNVGFPDINTSTHTINQKWPGSLNLAQVHQAMNGTNSLVLRGIYNAKDMMVIREAAGYKDPSASSKSTKVAAPQTLEVLDMSIADIEENDYYQTIKPDFFANTQLTSLKLPNSSSKIEAKSFENVPLKTLELKCTFAMGPRPDHIGEKYLVIDSEAFTGLNTEACDLVTSDWATEALSTDETGQLLFMNRKFKSITVYVIKDMYPTDELYQFVTTNAETHTVTSKSVAGLIKAEDVTKALNGGTALKVTGVLKDKDITTIGTTAGATLTSLTFDNIGEYVPTDNAFTGFTNSANCDLVIPDAWKSLVSMVDGRLKMCGATWISVKDKNGVDIIAGVDPNPEIGPWNPGDGADLETE